MIDRLIRFSTTGRRPRVSLGRRLVFLSALAVSLAVVMVALAAYWMTRFMLINQLDNELLDVATVTATPIAADVESMGGLNADALRAASVTLLLVSSDGFDASAVNYGMIPDDVEEVLRGACPVVASYGGRDRQLVGEVPRLQAALEANGVPHDLEVYPGAGPTIGQVLDREGAG